MKVRNGSNNFGAYFDVFYLSPSSPARNLFTVAGWRLFTSDGTETRHDGLVMAVVLLRDDVTFTKSENNAWVLDEY